MKNLEKFIINEELKLLLYRIQSRDQFSGLLWALELFEEQTNSLIETEILKKFYNYKNKCFETYKKDNISFEEIKKQILGYIFNLFLETLFFSPREKSFSLLEKEDIFILSELLYRINIEFKKIEFYSIADTLIKRLDNLKQFSNFEIINTLIENLQRNINNYCNKQQSLEDFCYNIQLDLFNTQMKLSEKLTINVYLVGEDKYSIIENQDKIKKNLHGYIFNNNINLNSEHVNLLWITENDYNLSDFKDLVFDKIFYPNEIEKILNLIYNNKQKHDLMQMFYFSLYRELNLYLDKVVETIVIGSSYARWGILKNIANFDFIKLTSPSQDMYTSYSFLKYFLENSKKSQHIKRCILPVGHWIFSRDLSLSANQRQIEHIKTYIYTILGSTHNFIQKFVPDFYTSISYKNNFIAPPPLKYCFDITQLQNKVYCDLLPINEEFNYIEKFTDYENWNFFDKVNEAKSAMLRLTNLQKYRDTYIENINIFENLINLLNEYNIELILLLTPLSETYFEVLDNDLKNDYENIIDSNSSKYRYIDMNKISGLKFTDSDFFDCHHLNKQGATKLTSYLNKIINDSNI